MNYKNTTYNRGGIWSPGSWSTELSTLGTHVHVVLYGREQDRRFWTTCEVIDGRIAQINQDAFTSFDDMIFHVLRGLGG